MIQLCCLQKLTRWRIWRRRHVVLGRFFFSSDNRFHSFHVFFQDSERASWHHVGPPTKLQVRKCFGFIWNSPLALVGINVCFMLDQRTRCNKQTSYSKWRCGYISKILLAKRGPLSIVNRVAMYEAQLAQKSLSNKKYFCWWRWRICVTNFSKSAQGTLSIRLLIAQIPIEISASSGNVTTL